MPRTPDQEIEAVEADISRLLKEARNSEHEAASVAVSDYDRSVELDMKASATRKLVTRLHDSLPALYAKRREQALVARDAEIDKGLADEQQAVRDLAGRILELAVQAANIVAELRALRPSFSVGFIPLALNGLQVINYLLIDQRQGAEQVAESLRRDAAEHMGALATAAAALKREAREDEALGTYNTYLVPVVVSLRVRLSDFSPPSMTVRTLEDLDKQEIPAAKVAG